MEEKTNPVNAGGKKGAQALPISKIEEALKKYNLDITDEEVQAAVRKISSKYNLSHLQRRTEQVGFSQRVHQKGSILNLSD